MTGLYEEIVRGESIRRLPPGERHEVICSRLHQRVEVSLSRLAAVELLPRRDIVELASGTLLRPDLTLVATETGKAFLIAEIVDPCDHTTDTVLKKTLYEDLRLPRLWMVDPRYGNVEVYRGTPYGLSLKQTLAGRDVLEENLITDLKIPVQELFAD